MNRVEVAKNLAECEETRAQLEGMIKDAESYYFDKFVVTTQVESRDFNKQTTEFKELVPNTANYVKFLKNELESVKHEIGQYIKMLTE